MRVRVCEHVAFDLDTEVTLSIDDIQAALREHLDNARDVMADASELTPIGRRQRAIIAVVTAAYQTLAAVSADMIETLEPKHRDLIVAGFEREVARYRQWQCSERTPTADG
jgi:hypothetical protein